MLVGSAYAYLEGQNQLFLFENGSGALNLPYRSSEVGVDHARSVHPISLSFVSNIVTRVLGRPFKIHNPFIEWTKAEMCNVINEMSVSDIAWTTWSCDRARGALFVQCGRCSSCLLRRQSFIASDTEDRTRYLIHVETGTKHDNLLRESHLLHMTYQARTLRQIFQRDDAWDVLSQ